MSVLREALDHQPETKAFWSELAEGRFKLRYCRACERAHWYPRAICPHCASPETEWRPASGQGTIYSYSIARTAAQPFAIAYVTLAEGPTMMTNIVNADPAKLAIGQKVRVALVESENGQKVPMFEPA